MTGRWQAFKALVTLAEPTPLAVATRGLEDAQRGQLEAAARREDWAAQEQVYVARVKRLRLAIAELSQGETP